MKLIPVYRVKRAASKTIESGVLVPEPETDQEGALSGMTNYQLVVYNPAELPQSEGRIETGQMNI